MSLGLVPGLFKPASSYLIIFNALVFSNIFDEKIYDDGIQSEDRWCRMRPHCQLHHCHHHCPPGPILIDDVAMLLLLLLLLLTHCLTSSGSLSHFFQRVIQLDWLLGPFQTFIEKSFIARRKKMATSLYAEIFHWGPILFAPGLACCTVDLPLFVL